MNACISGFNRSIRSKMESIRYRYDEQEQKEHFGVAEVVFEKARHDETRQCRKCRDNGPTCIAGCPLQHDDQTCVKFKNKPKEGRETQQPALRRKLHHIIFQVSVVE